MKLLKIRLRGTLSNGELLRVTNMQVFRAQ